MSDIMVDPADQDQWTKWSPCCHRHHTTVQPIHKQIYEYYFMYDKCWEKTSQGNVRDREGQGVSSILNRVIWKRS